MFTRRAHHLQRSARAFTVVEMLIVVAIVILLLSILIVALSAAARTSQAASTTVRMQSLSRGLVQFKTDMSYYPPVLNIDRDLLNLPGHDPIAPGYRDLIQDYTSMTSLAEYMAGFAGRDQDGYGALIGGSAGDTERPPYGIRHPGVDGVWGATLNGGGGTLAERAPKTTGDVFGPYIEVDDPRLIGSIDGTTDPTGKLNVYFPGEAGYNDADPKVIVDYWGRPIQYFRRAYPIGGIRQGYTKVDRDGNGTIDRTPSLGDIFVLRPFTIRSGADIPGIADDGGDTATTAALNNAEFALFSSGPDLTANKLYRFDDPDLQPDTSFANRDNVVEVGP